jgi:hypothetical protein
MLEHFNKAGLCVSRRLTRGLRTARLVSLAYVLLGIGLIISPSDRSR